MAARPEPDDRASDAAGPAAAAATVRLCLTGDVMCGRGVDQILRHPGDPTIHESWLRSAGAYVELAEQHSGPIPRRVPPTYMWGEVLDELRGGHDALVVNLETAVTDRGRPWPRKPIQYRMHPANVDVLTAAGVDVAVLANNHVLDWSAPGLDQTLDVLDAAGIARAGAGRTAAEAWRPAAVPAEGRRVVVFAAATVSSGVPPEWAATGDAPGVALLPDLSDATVDTLAEAVPGWTRPGDLVVLSLHWGPNWGYEIPAARRRFAHRVVERAGVHVVHGHSSHHALGIEVHGGHLILHGCGDLLTDYEGIGGHEAERGDLGGLYLPTLDARTGELASLEIVPTRVVRFRLTHPDRADRAWLARVLDREGARLGTGVRETGGRLVVDW